MIDNYDKILPLLEFDPKGQPADTFYYGFICRRRKENPNIGSENVVLRDYYFDNEKKFLDKKEEIDLFCKTFNARMYLNLNKRSYNAVMLESLTLLSEYIKKNSPQATKGLFTTACGRTHAQKDKRWILDVDVKDEEFIQKVLTHIEGIRPLGDKLIARLPTKNGVHLICKPFDLSQFEFGETKCGNGQDPYEVGIHKNNPTVLYAI